jgi:hypothetical protein
MKSSRLALAAGGFRLAPARAQLRCVCYGKVARGCQPDGLRNSYYPGDEGFGRMVYRRHCERREAIHSFFMFAALAMTVEYTSAFSRRDAPGVLRLLPPRKSEGAGNAGCTLHPRSHVRCASKNAAHEHTGSAEAIRHSLRNGFTAYAVLTPATNSVLVTVADGLRLVEPGRADFASASLTSATDARPTRFCRTQQPVTAKRLHQAMAPFVCAPLHRSREARPAIALAPTLPRPPLPAPRS